MSNNKVLTLNAWLRCGASALVVSAASIAAPVWAQSTAPGVAEPADTPASDDAAATNIDQSSETSANPNANEEALAADPSGEEVIVTGTRRALQTSQNIKRNADTVVDSITATDIGAFPDKSVAESLQRVPGVTVNRFAASDDTSHFSADPSGVLIRGLTQVRSEINGRDQFSANSSRGLSWGDISPELLAGVDTYKNQTAELIEGGIAGTINLRTRVPFDSAGQIIQGSVNLNYGDISKKLTPDVSAIYSTRFDTDAGEFGILGSVAYSELQSRSLGVTYGRMAVFEDVYQDGFQYIPSSVGFRDTTYDRTRFGTAVAAQWRDPSRTFLATVQYNRSEYDETWRERGVISYLTDLFAFPANFVFREGGANASRIPRTLPGSPAFTFDDDGNFETGLLVNQQTDFSWWGASDADAARIALNDRGENMLNPCYSWGPGTPGACGPDARGPDLNAVTRYNESERMTQDLSFNFKWEPSDRFGLNFDAQYVDSKVDNYDVEVGQYSFANVFLDTTGGRPRVDLSAPTNINQSAGGLSNPNNYRYNHVMDHLEDSDGEELAFRLDGAYQFDGDWLEALKVGVRYADRDQTVRYTAFNWGNISNNWNLDSGQAAYWNIDRTAPNGAFTGYPSGLIDVRGFGNRYFGNSGEFAFFDMNALRNRRANELSFSNIGVGQDRWGPVCSNGGTANAGPRTAEVDGTCFTPGEINRVSEATTAAYAMLKFGSPDGGDGGQRVSGNFGVRYVRTEVKSAGSLVAPTPFNLPTAAQCTGPLPTPEPGQPPATRPVGCYLSADDIAFASGGSTATTIRETHHHFLPSFNMRVELSPKWQLRFAASRALARPDIGYLKNYFTTSSSLPSTISADDPRIVRDASGNPVGVNPTYLASAYNPSLKPTTATQFDISIENYFAAVGSFTVAGFYKAFDDYIQLGEYQQNVTINGVTRSVLVRSPLNGSGASLYGAEAGFQRFFDFLPGALSGLGIQANATYVENNGIRNSGLKTQSGTEGGSQAQPGSAGTTLSVDDLEGLSKYAYNLVGLYEKSGLAVRVAYNWRSKFLVTAVDCCTYLPAYQKAAGYLDASIRYALNQNVEISLQGTNLLNTETKLEQQVTDAADGGVLVPNSWFRNDRRFILGARVKF